MSERPATGMPADGAQRIGPARRLNLDVDLDPAITADDAVSDLEGRHDSASRDRLLRDDVPPHHG